jgi:tetratricopeptide (TPR) repeat protein
MGMLAINDAIWTAYRWGLRYVDPDHPMSLAIRAEEALGEQKWGVAFDLSHAALSKQEDFGPAFFVRAISRLHLDDYQGALNDLNHFLALVEEPPPIAYYWRGWVYTHKGEWSLALSDFNRVLASGADDAQLHYWRTFVYWQRENWPKMKTSLERLEALSPNSAPAAELRAHLLLHDGSYKKAEAAYSYALQEGWDNPDLRYNRAVVRRHLGRHGEAKDDIEAIFEMDPNNLWAHLELSKFAFSDCNYTDALYHARLASMLNPNFFEARISEAATLMAMRRHSEAAVLLQLMQEEFPDEPLVDQFYGDLLTEEDNCSGAVESYRAVLQKNPAHHAIRIKLANTLITLEYYEEAEAELNKVLADMPEAQDAYSTRADLYRYSNQPDKMRADIEKILELNPNNGWALGFRAAHRQWLGDIKGALRDYNAAIEADMSEAWIWAFRGQLHSRSGRLKEAREDFQIAIILEPENAWIRRQWADLLFRCGHPERAAEVLSCLVQDEPNDGFPRLFRTELHLIAEEWEAAQYQLDCIIKSEHELAWLAHAALAGLSQGQARQHHLTLADEKRPQPTFWGMTPAIILAQTALVRWQQGERATAKALLQQAIEQLEIGELPWLALYPLFTRLEATPLLAILDNLRRCESTPLGCAVPLAYCHACQ